MVVHSRSHREGVGGCQPVSPSSMHCPAEACPALAVAGEKMYLSKAAQTARRRKFLLIVATELSLHGSHPRPQAAIRSHPGSGLSSPDAECGKRAKPMQLAYQDILWPPRSLPTLWWTPAWGHSSPHDFSNRRRPLHRRPEDQSPERGKASASAQLSADPDQSHNCRSRNVEATLPHAVNQRCSHPSHRDCCNGQFQRPPVDSFELPQTSPKKLEHVREMSPPVQLPVIAWMKARRDASITRRQQPFTRCQLGLETQKICAVGKNHGTVDMFPSAYVGRPTIMPWPLLGFSPRT